MVDLKHATAVAAAVDARQEEIASALASLSDEELFQPTLLPGWDRLTLACHLRYGARASLWVTDEALRGERTSFYPEGRIASRPATLQPNEGESARDVVEDLAARGRALSERWNHLSAGEWAARVREPDDNVDRGEMALLETALFRLTEIEAHGTDFDLGLGPWSQVFVDVGLPYRLSRLPLRARSRELGPVSINGSWLLVASDANATLVVVQDQEIAVELGASRDADAIIEATSRDLLAFLLGRPAIDTVDFRGDVELAERFREVFPGP
jgi:uncharacterized protein (TIGR03083 family)